MGEAKPSMAKVNPGDSILLATSNDTYQFVDAKPSVKFRIGKQQVKATDLVDASFGQLFTLQNKALVPTTRDALNITLEASNNNKKDNRDLDDDNKAQSLDADAIKDMRSRGETGAAIIGALAEGSATWDSKTEFSKAKWLKRKAKKYLPWVQVLEPTANAIAEAYFVRAAGKGRRRDSQGPRCGPTPSRSSWPAATSAPARVVVVDACHGVVAGAVAERCGERGNVLLLYEGQQATMDAVKKFNFSDALRGAIATAPADVFYAESSRPEAESLARDAEAAAAAAERTEDARPRRDHGATCRAWLRARAHALVLAPSLDPLSVLRATLPALHPSCAVVVYGDHLEPLARAFAWLRDSGHAVRVQLTETWQRDFQILENRSHPDMAMTATRARDGAERRGQPRSRDHVPPANIDASLNARLRANQM
ncbi:hypothetical protein JL722_11349 [Aureococcus anophagefferens]|nr:hypothetical protein JL722_11349 [Aureococcus anophagefferens]